MPNWTVKVRCFIQCFYCRSMMKKPLWIIIILILQLRSNHKNVLSALIWGFLRRKNRLVSMCFIQRWVFLRTILILKFSFMIACRKLYLSNLRSMADIIIELKGLHYFTGLKYHAFLRFPIKLFIKTSLVQNYRFRKEKH